MIKINNNKMFILLKKSIRRIEPSLHTFYKICHSHLERELYVYKDIVFRRDKHHYYNSNFIATFPSQCNPYHGVIYLLLDF